MKTLVWVEHDGSSVKDATLAVVTAASKLGEVHLLVAGSGVDAVAKEAAQIAGAAGVIVVAMGQQQIFDLLGSHAQGREVGEQPLLTVTGAGVHQRDVLVEVDQVNGGILGSGQTLAAHLEDFAGDGDRARHKDFVLKQWH